MSVADGLVRELRAAGIPVALSEHIDATRALAETDLLDRAAVRAALRTTLIKDATQHPTFDLVFDLYFSEKASTGIDPLSDVELRVALAEAVRANDGLLLRRVIGLLVDRHAGIEPGLPVAGTIYRTRTMRAIDPLKLRAELLDEATGTLDRGLAADRADAGVQRVEREVEAEIRRRLVADRGAEAVARTLRTPLPQDVDFLRASQRETDALKAAIQPLARKLAARLAEKRRRGARGALDFRRTIRRSLSTGGVLAEPVFRPRRPAKPKLVVLADISGSVATFAAFTLRLVHALRAEFTAVRSFVFVDGVDEVTDLFGDSAELAGIARAINARAAGVRLDGRSDYGQVLESFRQRFAAGLDPRSTVLILGDARSNYHEPRADALARIAARAGQLHWLNPEPESAWDSGDSVIGRYAPNCTSVVECRTIRQLRGFVESLD